MLFQDEHGGLQFFDRASGFFVDAFPQEGVLYLNIGDMFERISNGRQMVVVVNIHDALADDFSKSVSIGFASCCYQESRCSSLLYSIFRSSVFQWHNRATAISY